MIPAFCVNLRRRPDRWGKVHERFYNVGVEIERWDAVDGKTLSIPEDSRKIKEFNSRGILGCTLSHLNLIKHAKENGYERIMVLEDDAVPCIDFLDRLTKIEQYDYDMFYLGGHFRHFGRGATPLNTIYLYKCNDLSGTYGYIITDKLYDYVIDNLNYQWGADEFFATKVQKQFDVKCMIPMLVTHEDGFSDVAGRDAVYKETRRFFKKDMRK